MDIAIRTAAGKDIVAPGANQVILELSPTSRQFATHIEEILAD